MGTSSLPPSRCLDIIAACLSYTDGSRSCCSLFSSTISLQELETVTSTDFFWRYTYHTAARRFSPEQVPVYCTCELPENPDLFMAECDGCLHWFHPHPCEGVDPAEVQTTGKFMCRKCRLHSATKMPVSQKLAPVALPAAVPRAGQRALTGEQVQVWANDPLPTRPFLYEIRDQ